MYQYIVKKILANINVTQASVTRCIFILLFSLQLSACNNDSHSSSDSWPTRSVSIVVYSSAGGATDLANRAIAEGMKQSLDISVITSNMPGAMGATAINYVWNQQHDGYRMVGLSEGALGHSILGLHTSTAKDWEYFMIGGTPGIISVNANSKYRTFTDLYNDIKSNPGKLKIATSVPGCIWNVQWLLSKKLGAFDTQYVPYPGSFPSQTATLSGEVDIVWTGLGEQSEFIKGGNLRPLAVFSEKGIEFANGIIPPITDFIPALKSTMPINQFVGFALPSDTPENVLQRVAQSFTQAMKSDAVTQFGEAKYSKLYGWHGDQAKQVALAQEKVFAWTLWDAGLAKKNPKELGIERPPITSQFTP